MRRAAGSGAVLSIILLTLWASYAPAREARPHLTWEDSLRFEVKPHQIMEDFDYEPLYDCPLQYFYYIPCLTCSWFWAYYG
jgi:hypothetical protein